ncbi:MAG: hypothetical protein MUO76_04785, partial [Anaerolineaceae bacterium]|nr:hypothetical protein [Anaerolineaceae bacterium]
SEWASPDFHQLIHQSMLNLLFLVFIAFGLSNKRVDGTDLVTLLWFAYLAFIARRNYGPFAMVAIPVLSRQIQNIVNTPVEKIVEDTSKSILSRIRKIIETGSRSHISENKQRIINLFFVAFLGLIGFLKVFVVSYPVLVNHYLIDQVPLDAFKWIEENEPQGNLFNEYNWGGYIIWHLKDYPVFVDGRTDLFDDVILGEWIIAAQAEDGWEEILDKWGINTVILRPDRVITKLLEFYGWTEEYEDEKAIIFTR